MKKEGRLSGHFFVINYPPLLICFGCRKRKRGKTAAGETTSQISVILNNAGLFLTKIHPGWAGAFKMNVLVHWRFSVSFSVTVDKATKQTPPAPPKVSGICVCTFTTWIIKSFNLLLFCLNRFCHIKAIDMTIKSILLLYWWRRNHILILYSRWCICHYW